MAIPGPLRQKIAQSKENGRVSDRKNDLFNELSWLELMYGQGLRPKGYHPLVDVLPKEEIIHRVKAVADVIERSVDIMPTHAEFIACTCPAVVGEFYTYVLAATNI